mmetsp:Transcript_51583/g.118479  ORF Transcript_51583/g.118479 Transcript_51583/m.118479 type:complete len:227 (+) Transcript_51583:623-1303(+)
MEGAGTRRSSHQSGYASAGARRKGSTTRTSYYFASRRLGKSHRSACRAPAARSPRTLRLAAPGRRSPRTTARRRRKRTTAKRPRTRTPLQLLLPRAHALRTPHRGRAVQQPYSRSRRGDSTQAGGAWGARVRRGEYHALCSGPRATCDPFETSARTLSFESLCVAPTGRFDLPPRRWRLCTLCSHEIAYRHAHESRGKRGERRAFWHPYRCGHAASFQAASARPHP